MRWISKHKVPDADENFHKGLYAIQKNDIRSASAWFASACYQVDDHHEYANLYLASYGMSCLLLGEKDGLELCRRAAYFETRNAEVFSILVQAEQRLGHRERAVNAMHRGLVVEPRNPGLLKLRNGLGYRRKPVLRKLGRDHWLNRILGKLRTIQSRVST